MDLHLSENVARDDLRKPWIVPEILVLQQSGVAGGPYPVSEPLTPVNGSTS